MNVRGFHIVATVFLFLVSSSLFQSCSLIKKGKSNSADASGNVPGGEAASVSQKKKKKSPEKVESDLLAIANSSASMLPSTSSESPEAETPADNVAPSEASPAKKEGPGASPESPATSGLDSSRIHIGDIFIGKEGMALRKIASFSDALFKASVFKASSGIESSLLQQVETVRPATVPLTISQSELASLKKKVKSGVSLPSRSVALDFKSTIHTAKLKELEGLLGKLASGKVSELSEDTETSRLLKSQMEEIKKLLSSDETLYVVTKVTRSESALASYPGAPLGKRDVNLIKNAVIAMFPQFDSLDAEKKENKVLLSHPKGMTWTFEASSLRAKGSRFKIDPTQAHTF